MPIQPISDRMRRHPEAFNCFLKTYFAAPQSADTKRQPNLFELLLIDETIASF